jgi:hypothetical protein
MNDTGQHLGAVGGNSALVLERRAAARANFNAKDAKVAQWTAKDSRARSAQSCRWLEGLTARYARKNRFAPIAQPLRPLR